MLHYTEFKHTTSEEWVTFIHGAGGSSAIWYKQLKAFKEEFNVLLIDLRGHGRSKEKMTEVLKRYTFDFIGNEVIEVLDHRKIKQSHFIGISLGTMIIRELSDRFPERISSQIMGGAILQLNFRGQLLMRLGVLLKTVVPYIFLYKFFAWIIMPRPKHKESRVLFVREAKKLYQNEFKRWFTLASEINPLLKLFRTQAPSIPTLYIMGEEDYMFLPAVRKQCDMHALSSLMVIPNCGHVVNVEQPLTFNIEAISFIQRNLGGRAI